MLIFVQSVERAKALFHELVYDNIFVDVIHSERTQAQRENIIKKFRLGEIWVLIATDLLGRGMDFKVGLVRRCCLYMLLDRERLCRADVRSACARVYVISHI